MLNLTRISTRDSIFPIRPSGRLRSSTDTHRQDIDDTHMIRHACSLHAVTQFALVIECVGVLRLWASERRAGARDELTRPARRCTTAKDDSKQGLTPCSCLCRLYARMPPQSRCHLSASYCRQTNAFATAWEQWVQQQRSHHSASACQWLCPLEHCPSTVRR
jgi:hypothetical protein